MRVAVATDGDQNNLAEGEIEMGPASNGVIRIKLDNGRTQITHVNDVLPLDEEAEERMKNGYVRAGRGKKG